jgi:alpha/beta hydrolase family protein
MPENEFPFSTAAMKDPVSGKAGALLRGEATDPFLIDPLGRKDVALPSRSRVYMMAGTQHGGRAGVAATPGPCANPRNPHSAAPALRALLVALDRWVSEGGESHPRARFPRSPPRRWCGPATPDFLSFQG